MTHGNTNVQEQNDSLVLLQFYADWCQPCGLMMPIVESIKQKQFDWLVIKQIDIDKDYVISNQFYVRSVPAFVVMKNDKEIWRKTGTMSEYSFSEILESLK